MTPERLEEIRTDKHIARACICPTHRAVAELLEHIDELNFDLSFHIGDHR